MIRFYIDTHYHVGIPDKTIIRDLYDRSKNNSTLEERKKLYKLALEYHHNNQNLYDWIMKGFK